MRSNVAFKQMACHIKNFIIYSSAQRYNTFCSMYLGDISLTRLHIHTQIYTCIQLFSAYGACVALSHCAVFVVLCIFKKHFYYIFGVYNAHRDVIKLGTQLAQS